MKRNLFSKRCVFLSLSLILSVLLGALQAQATSEILRSADGSLRRMNFWDASGVNFRTAKKDKPDACEAAGKGRLPTIRELAQESQLNGAMGILEPDQASPGSRYYKISATDPSGKNDEFYFFEGGYVRPSSDFGSSEYFWSSSIISSYYGKAYALNGFSGGIASFGLTDRGVAVLCLIAP